MVFLFCFIPGMINQNLHGYVFQNFFVTSLWNNFRSSPRPECFNPPAQTNTPSITCLQSRECELGSGCTQVITHLHGKFEKIIRHYCTNRMLTKIGFISFTASVSEKTGDRRQTTAFQFSTKYIVLSHFITVFN